jgi:hypothetical protein
MSNTATATFVKSADKKHCVKFEEVPAAGEPQMAGTIYVQNYILQRLGITDSLVVTVTKKEG